MCWSWSAARCRAQSALCWALNANAKSRIVLQEYTRERLQRKVRTSPAVDPLVKIPYFQPANRSCYLRPFLSNAMADAITVHNEHKIYRLSNPKTAHSTWVAYFQLLLVLLRFGLVCPRTILTAKSFPLDLQAELTDHRDCHPKPSLKLVMESLETSITEKSEYFADTPSRKLYSEASGTPDRHPLIPV